MDLKLKVDPKIVFAVLIMVLLTYSSTATLAALSSTKGENSFQIAVGRAVGTLSNKGGFYTSSKILIRAGDAITAADAGVINRQEGTYELLGLSESVENELVVEGVEGCKQYESALVCYSEKDTLVDVTVNCDGGKNAKCKILVTSDSGRKFVEPPENEYEDELLNAADEWQKTTINEKSEEIRQIDENAKILGIYKLFLRPNAFDAVTAKINVIVMLPGYLMDFVEARLEYLANQKYGEFFSSGSLSPEEDVEIKTRFVETVNKDDWMSRTWTSYGLDSIETRQAIEKAGKEFEEFKTFLMEKMESGTIEERSMWASAAYYLFDGPRAQAEITNEILRMKRSNSARGDIKINLVEGEQISRDELVALSGEKVLVNLSDSPVFSFENGVYVVKRDYHRMFFEINKVSGVYEVS
ncbi:hypothetical protein COU38_04175 [Candidatus Micrarchaeota archaeon CG10_big_fil_rev_8_21_14_0_10_54_18]|nr:MAG: hypothetical protein COT57_00850 [Candidatus Micrarchaeota archaeon CG09_land_8_20_14_0_10_55_25]PJD00866.1 MAG: hypothetical protein COU38_04175 [Candidatus Micrarchaeota archaeon CG10_big_fil_rev_8_21_14_0_10_54_18]